MRVDSDVRKPVRCVDVGGQEASRPVDEPAAAVLA